MLTRIKKLSRVKKAMLTVFLIMMMVVSYFGYVRIQEYRKWTAVDAELKSMGGSFIWEHPQNLVTQNIRLLNLPYKLENVIRKNLNVRTGISCSKGSISTSFLKRIPEDNSLRYFMLYNSKITDEIILTLSKFSNMTDLALSNSNITGKYFDELTQLKFLKKINLNRTKINDSAIEKLSKSSNISSLNISNTLITDKCIPHLIKMKKLYSINISGTKISAQGLKELKTKMPSCTIE